MSHLADFGHLEAGGLGESVKKENLRQKKSFQDNAE